MKAESHRLAVKTAEGRFLRIMEQEYHYAPRISISILEEAEECLKGNSKELKPGQQRVILVERGNRSGQRMEEMGKTEVIWTVDRGLEDVQLKDQIGRKGLRQARIKRLLEEAREQGGGATQEDLAWVLQVSTRTIKRDYAELRKKGEYLPSRGYQEGIGRGQSHKSEILRRWLKGETYDQIRLHTRHSSGSIKRYVQSFVHVIHLLKKGFGEEEIARLLQMGAGLVRAYTHVYEENQDKQSEERLNIQIKRLMKGEKTRKTPKKGEK